MLAKVTWFSCSRR